MMPEIVHAAAGQVLPRRSEAKSSRKKLPKELIEKVTPGLWQGLPPVERFSKIPKRWPSRLLLDTPALDYLVRDAYRLSQTAVVAINEPGIVCFVSECSWLELAEKMKKGDFAIRCSIGEFMQSVMTHFHLQLLPMDAASLEKYRQLPDNKFPVRPVCHWLAAQALATGCTIISPDTGFDQFPGVKRLW